MDGCFTTAIHVEFFVKIPTNKLKNYVIATLYMRDNLFFD